MTDTAMFADPLRAYIVTLRRGRHITQAELAKRIGMAERTYVSWERGTTKSIKEHFARALIAALDGSREHLDRLDQMSAEEAEALAQSWLSLPAPEREKLSESREKLRRVIELSDDDPAQLEEVIEELRRQARGDPTLLSWVAGYLARGPSGRRPKE